MTVAIDTWPPDKQQRQNFFKRSIQASLWSGVSWTCDISIVLVTPSLSSLGEAMNCAASAGRYSGMKVSWITDLSNGGDWDYTARAREGTMEMLARRL
jgi:hypothetical protein